MPRFTFCDRTEPESILADDSAGRLYPSGKVIRARDTNPSLRFAPLEGPVLVPCNHVATADELTQPWGDPSEGAEMVFKEYLATIRRRWLLFFQIFVGAPPETTAAGIEHHSEERLDLGPMQALDPRQINCQLVAQWIALAIQIPVIAIAAVGYFLFSELANDFTTTTNILIWTTVAVFFVARSFFRQYWIRVAYRHIAYRMDNHGIEIRRGVWWKQVANVPRSRVQHTDVTRGPLERRFGLATLVIHTAGTSHSTVSLSGLAEPTARELRDILLKGREQADAV